MEIPLLAKFDTFDGIVSAFTHLILAATALRGQSVTRPPEASSPIILVGDSTVASVGD